MVSSAKLGCRIYGAKKKIFCMDNTPLYTVFTFRFLQNFPGMRLTSHLLEESPVIRKVWSNNPDVESSIGSSGVGSSRSQIVCSVVGVIKVTFALRSTKKWESSSSLPLSGWCFSPNSWVRSLRVTVWNTQPYVPSSNNNNNKKKTLSESYPARLHPRDSHFTALRYPPFNSSKAETCWEIPSTTFYIPGKAAQLIFYWELRPQGVSRL